MNAKNQLATIISTTSKARIQQAGLYQVYAISEAGCRSEVQEIKVVLSEKPTIALQDILINDETANNTLEVVNTNLGVGTYLFSLDGISYSSTTFFENLSAPQFLIPSEYCTFPP